MRARSMDVSIAGAVAFAVGLSVSPGIAAQMHWVYEAADPQKTFGDYGDYDAVLDAEGYAHVIYGRDSLYYDWEDADGWHSEMADATAAPAGLDLVLDTAGLPHVTYVDELTYHVKYAHRDLEGWTVETIAEEAYGSWSAVCLDSSGRPQVGYVTGVRDFGTERRLVHAGKETSGWQATTVGSWRPNTFNIMGLAIGVDGNDQARLACIAVSDFAWSIYHAWRTASGWASASIAVSGGAFKLAFDGNGLLHAVYYDEAGGGWAGITYILGRPGRFVTDHAFAVRWWADPLLAVSPEGVPHVAVRVYTGPSAQGLYYLSKAGQDWNQDFVSPGTACSPALALDELGRPHVYYDQAHAWRDGEGWQTQPEPSGPPCGEGGQYRRLLVQGTRLLVIDPSPTYGGIFHSQDTAGWHERVMAQAPIRTWDLRLALDAQNQPHLVYRNVDLGLRYVWRDTEGWQAASVDAAAGGYQSDCDLALDSGGRPHVAYLSGDGQHVLYAVPRDTGWDIATVDTNSFTTPFLALDSMERAHILVRESGTGLPVHFWEDSSGWHRESVPSPGADCRGLVVDHAGNLHTCSLTASGANSFLISHGVRTEQGWQFATVTEWTCEMLEGLALAVDELDRPHLVYSALNINRPGGNQLMYASQDGTSWQIETVESTTSEPLPVDPCLAVSGDGVPWITYVAQAGSVSEFRYAVRGVRGWRATTLEMGPPDSSSLAVDSQGRPHVVYCNVYGRRNISYIYAPPFSLTGLAPLANGLVHLDWQGALEGVGVECAASLSGDWSPVTENLSGLEGEIDVDPAMRFFRLRQTDSP